MAKIKKHIFITFQSKAPVVRAYPPNNQGLQSAPGGRNRPGGGGDRRPAGPESGYRPAGPESGYRPAGPESSDLTGPNPRRLSKRGRRGA